VTFHACQGLAQGAFPAPLPGQSSAPRNDPAFPPVGRNDSAFPPVNSAAPAASLGGPAPSAAFPPPSGAFPSGAAPMSGAAFAPPPPQGGPPDACAKGFVPLREEAEKRGKLIKAASDRHAPPDEACKLITNFGQAELKMIKYVQTFSAKCGIPPQIADQLKVGHQNTEKMQNQVCNVAKQAQTRGPAGPSLSEVLGSSAALPEATPTKKGGSTFDTLNGNVLTR
jgi:hypothetical protein